MNKILLLFFIPLTSIGQSPPMKVIDSLSKTDTIYQKGYNSEYPGAYSQIVNYSNTIVEPGEKISIKYKITGYGKIDYRTVKIYFGTSSNIFEINKSIIKGSFMEGDGVLYFGGTEALLAQESIMLFNPQVRNSNGVLINTMFDDRYENRYNSSKIKSDTLKTYNNGIENFENFTSIYSETTLMSRDSVDTYPIELKVKLLDDLKAGDYQHNIILTYFNGEKWETERSSTNIHVQSWYEINDRLFQILAWVIAVMTIIGFLFSIPRYASVIKSLYSSSKSTKKKKKKLNKNDKKSLNN